MFGYAHGDLIRQPLEILLPERTGDAHVVHWTAYFAEPRVRPNADQPAWNGDSEGTRR
jgi:hypothetical protein